jgi:hypothetical protein
MYNLYRSQSSQVFCTLQRSVPIDWTVKWVDSMKGYMRYFIKGDDDQALIRFKNKLIQIEWKKFGSFCTSNKK